MTTVKDLFDLLEQKENWSFTVYVDGLSNNVLAYANGYYDVEGIYKTDNLYNVADLFSHEVVSFFPSNDGLYVKIKKFSGMKYRDFDIYIDKDGVEHAHYVTKEWQ